MPSTSKKQHNFMAAVANNPTFAKKVGVPQSVGKDFNQADKGKTFKEGGDMKQVDMKKNPGMAKLPTAVRNKMGYMKKGGMAESGMHKMPDGKMMKNSAMKKMNMGGMAKGGGIEAKGKTKGKQITMKNGGKC